MDDFSLLTRVLRTALPKLELRENEPMKNHCSFHIGGDAALIRLSPWPV